MAISISLTTAPFKGPEDYPITSDSCELPISDEIFKWHHYNYKSSQQKFENWLAEVQEHNGEFRLNFSLTLTKAFIRDQGVLPKEQLENLQKWLRGRQVCYYVLLSRDEAGDEHMRPIEVAAELIQLFKPETSSNLIAECTPVNLSPLVEQRGSERAKDYYCRAGSSKRPRERGRSSRSSSPSSDRELELKLRRMSECSWRRQSVSDNDSRSRRSSLSSCSWRSLSSPNSSSTSLSSQESQSMSRSKSQEALSTNLVRNYASAVSATPETSSALKSRPTLEHDTPPRKGRLVLMTKGARSRSTSPSSSP